MSIKFLPGLPEVQYNKYIDKHKLRILRISLLSVCVAIAICFIAKFLILLIDVVTNLSFYGKFSLESNGPANNHLGLWVILVPAIGGLVVGLMALYGSKAIRGHGIPEAMEQILTNQSKIKPSITFLKPVSSAIAIGTGGPFGAEGPIIATGGALGSTLGQLFKITSNERKVVLAAGATAGMAALFGTPIAGVFLAIELLLFEFSPRAILPVALACITGAAGHHLLFGTGPVFPMPDIAIPSNVALAIYSSMGLVIGFFSLIATKIVYLAEDTFAKLPVHWVWWPAIGGLVAGIIGYFAPHTLGVGYDNIISILSGTVAISMVFRLCFFKLISWAIALSSGTSGGTLAPLLTIGGAGGALLGTLILHFLPDCGINIPLAALIGMSSMFAGASRAYLTSIVFALESTGQFHSLLPLLGGCTASYLVSFFLMENTIMTEKIARRGIVTPDSYEADFLNTINVKQVLKGNLVVFKANRTLADVREWLKENKTTQRYFIVSDEDGNFSGIASISDVNDHNNTPDTTINKITQDIQEVVYENDHLRKVVQILSAHPELEALPAIADNKIVGIISQKDIIAAYQLYIEENENSNISIDLRGRILKKKAGRQKQA
ncbi:MAG: chloride channel protein [Mucilaginibacter sp.]